MEAVRQGDVWLQPVTVEGVEWREEQDHAVLALGESSGHHHRIYTPPGGMIATAILNNKKYLKVTKPAELWHDTARKVKADHEMLRVPEGIYEIIIENSYNPFLKKLERTVD